MKALLLGTALALLPGGFQGQETAEQVAELSAPPKDPVAGMAGFRSKSRVVLETDPEQTLLLETYYVFPERARWSLIAEGASAKERQLYFRFGARYWSIAPGEAESRPLYADTRESLIHQTRLHMELRRAAMLWPDGLDWEGQGEERSARSPMKAHHLFLPEPLPLVLRARMDESGRPREMRIHWNLRDERTLDTLVALRDITWRQQDERWWPHTFTLVGYGEAEWHETVESIDTAINALDSFFVPPDRRGELGARPSSAPRLVALPPTCQRRIPLEPGADLEAALREAARWTDREARRLQPQGLALAPGLALELDASGVPSAVLLRLESTPATLPEGWERLPERQAVSAPWPGRGSVSASSFGRLRALLPADARPQAGYLRIAPDAQGSEVRQLVLPFVRGR